MTEPMTGGEATGQLIGIARRERHRAPMERIDCGSVSVEAGLDGDYRGAKYPQRQLTVLAIEDWTDALRALAAAAASPQTKSTEIARPFDLDWTARRANLLVSGIKLPRGPGSLMRIGGVEIEITGETTPCARMDEVVPGLRRALASDWRGGVTCRVLKGGRIALTDPVLVIKRLEVRVRHLPG